jgi:hypothetical protein
MATNGWVGRFDGAGGFCGFVSPAHLAAGGAPPMAGVLLSPAYMATPGMRNNGACPTTAIQSVATGQCLDVPLNSRRNGLALAQYPCLGNPNQTFHLQPDGGAYRVRTNNGLCLTASGTANGSLVEQIACVAGESRQKWVVSGPTKPLRFMNAESGRCLDVDVASGRIQVWDCLGSPNQAWNAEVSL